MSHSPTSSANELLELGLISETGGDIVGLGVVPLGKTGTTLRSLRSVVKLQVASPPSHFQFLSKRRFPITKLQENNINVHQVVNDNLVLIKKCYDKHRVGITDHNGTNLGFCFLDVHVGLCMARNEIFLQKNFVRSFLFLDRNSWVIQRNQERAFQLQDILRNGIIYISCDDLSISNLQSQIDDEVLDGSPAKRMRLMSTEMPMCLINGDSNRRELQATKQLLVSYVRAEAADHALRLKSKLISKGFSVFLDVHEIHSGEDWQDILNYAISNCEVFVPLITPRYGQTQWTNREVKLADVLGKLVIPVSFLNEWPPKCLAIQFATTQYVPWKSQELLVKENELCGAEKALDISDWSEACIDRVAASLAERVSFFVEESQHGDASVALERKNSTLRSYPSILPQKLWHLACDRVGQPLIVISVHPNENSFAEDLQIFLEEKGYEVWLSCAVVPESSENSDSSSCLEAPSSQQMFSLSQRSFTSDACLSDAVSLQKCRRFQEKANQAKLIVLVLSESFLESRSSKQQVYYCEHRKRLLAVCLKDVVIPNWLAILIDARTILNCADDDWKCKLEKSVQVKLSSYEGDEEVELSKLNNINSEISHFQDLLQNRKTVLTIGCSGCSSQKYFGQTISDLFSSLEHVVGLINGRLNLPWDPNYMLMGYHGSEKEENGKAVKNDTNGGDIDKSNTYIAQSEEQMWSILLNVTDVCLLLGSNKRDVAFAEKLSWKDSVVIPVGCGHTNTSSSMPFQKPPSVSEREWGRLLSRETSFTDKSEALREVLREVLKKMLCKNAPMNFTSIKPCPSQVNFAKPRLLREDTLPMDPFTPST